MTATPQQIYDIYRKDQNQDMYDYSPFLRKNARGTILEIGVRGGVSTAAFLLGLEENGGHLFSVDINAECGQLYDHPQWTFIHANSLTDKDRIGMEVNRRPDILFIDGDHRKASFLSDLNNYAPMVRKGGLILVHDIIALPEVTQELVDNEWWANDDVRQVYEAYAADHALTRIDLPGRCGMGILIAR